MDTTTWAILSSMATTLGFVIVSITAIVALYQFIEMTKARTLEAFTRTLDELSSQQAAEARRYVYGCTLPPLDQIVPGTEVYTKLYNVYLPFDKVGLLIERKLIPEDIVLEMYGESIIIIWNKIKSHIYEERKRTGRERYQMYFEKLYTRSIRYLSKQYPQEIKLLFIKYPVSDV